ncbi:hypothetical protein D3C84_1231580 [compost metagenome]
MLTEPRPLGQDLVNRPFIAEWAIEKVKMAVFGPELLQLFKSLALLDAAPVKDDMWEFAPFSGPFPTQGIIDQGMD